MHVEFDRDFRFADTHVATVAGRVQHARDQELLPHVRTLVQEYLTGEDSNIKKKILRAFRKSETKRINLNVKLKSLELLLFSHCLEKMKFFKFVAVRKFRDKLFSSLVCLIPNLARTICWLS